MSAWSSNALAISSDNSFTFLNLDVIEIEDIKNFHHLKQLNVENSMNISLGINNTYSIFTEDEILIIKPQ